MFPNLNMLGINEKLREHWSSLTPEEKAVYKDTPSRTTTSASDTVATNDELDIIATDQATIKKCNACGRMFTNNIALENHKEECHSSASTSPVEDPADVAPADVAPCDVAPADVASKVGKSLLKM